MACHVRVEGSDRRFPIAPGDDLLEVLHANGERVATACGGVAMCGTCRVIVVAGDDALVPIKVREAEHVKSRSTSHVPGLRLACQAALRDRLENQGEREIIVRLPGIPRPC
jgi:ferredoxin